MQEEKDLVKREIQRLILFLSKIIGNATKLKTNDFEQGFKNIESDVESEFGFSLREISEMNETALIKKIEGLNSELLVKVVELIIALAHNLQGDLEYKLVKTGITILDFLDNNSKTYSLKRNRLKKSLQQWYL